MSYDQDFQQWDQGDGAQEQGVQVEPTTRSLYHYECSCGSSGQEWDTAEQANAEGIQHELSEHPRVFSVHQRGAY